MPGSRVNVARTEAVVASLWDAHEDVLTAIGQCADQVATEWDGGAAPDREVVVEPFEAAVASRELRPELLDLLETAVSTLEMEFVTTPVPAPPYVAMTSRGPVLRATTTTNRVVVTIAVFEPVGGGSGYRRRDGVEVEVTIRDRVTDRD